MGKTAPIGSVLYARSHNKDCNLAKKILSETGVPYRIVTSNTLFDPHDVPTLVNSNGRYAGLYHIRNFAQWYQRQVNEKRRPAGNY